MERAAGLLAGGVRGRLLIGAAWSVAVLSAAGGAQAVTTSPSVEDLSRMSLEELANVEVTSVAKRATPLGEAPAAVFVITNDDVHRSGALTLPEALRLAPNLQVGRVDVYDYAISARGLNSFETSNKLLVMIDGRSVYTPVYAGVEWDSQNVMLEDLDRIEVISGPGGTLWGANAVNGVINIISRPAQETQGLLVSAAGGSLDSHLNVRYGGALGDRGAWRVYGMAFDRGQMLLANGDEAPDNGEGYQLGFRTDFRAGGADVTLQGDAYDDPSSSFLIPDGYLRGGNLLGRWTRGSFAVQAYYDRAERLARGVYDSIETYDLEARQTLSPHGAHTFVWGAGYRLSRDEFDNKINAFVLDPASRWVSLGNVFAQDEIALAPDLTLTVGLKLEDSSYSGLEYLPSARVAWRASERALWWAAASRAVRTPSRVDRELVFPGFLARSNFRSETVVAWEAGYRGRPTDSLSVSVSAFYNQYDHIRTNELGPGNTFPGKVQNGAEGETWGVEAWGDLDLARWWRMGFGVSTLNKDFREKAGHNDLSNLKAGGDDPSWQASLRSQMQLAPSVGLDVRLRAVDDLGFTGTPGYVEADARLAWAVNDQLELSVAGFNLLDSQHVETGEFRSMEVPRSVYLGLRWMR